MHKKEVKIMSKQFHYIANWKMNMHFHNAITFCSSEYESLLELVKNQDIQITLCPSFVTLFSITQMFKQSRVFVGAQDCSAHQEGAYTGEVSAQSLHEAGVRFCIIGHSERRKHQYETNELVAQKMSQLLLNKIIPIICVGEPYDVYSNQKSLEYIQEQLIAVYNALKLTSVELFPYKINIAYEPIWAIGTGIIPNNDHIQSVATFIKKYFEPLSKIVTITVLYGGSVHSDNANLLKTISGLQGFLIGGASTDFQMFKKIVLST